MDAGAAGSLTGAAELFRFWVFPDCTFLDISIRPEDCVKIEPNNNPRFVDSDVYVFIKNDEIMVYGELELHKLYIKIYLREKKTYDTVIVISFHEEGLHGY